MKFLHTRKNTALMVLFVAFLSMTAEAAPSFSKILRQNEDVSEVEQYDTLTEQTFDYLNAFLNGFRSSEIIPSATSCSKYLQ